MGLAIPPQSQQPRRRARDLDRARGAGDCRTVRDDAGAARGEGTRGEGIVGDGCHGRPRTSAPGPRRTALPHLGPQRGCIARPRIVGRVVSSVSKVAVARRGTGTLFRETAHAPRVPAAQLADGAEPARLRDDAADRKNRRADASAQRRGAPAAPVRRQLHRVLGIDRAQIRSVRAPRRRVSELEVRVRAARPLRHRGAGAEWTDRGVRRVSAPDGAARPPHAARGPPDGAR